MHDRHGVGRAVDHLGTPGATGTVSPEPGAGVFCFLPALIFEAGFNLYARELLKELAPVPVLAVPALLISTTLVGLGVSLILQIDLETAFLRRFRERDWAAGLFTRYQKLRLEQRLQRDIAGILMCEGVLQMLRGHEENHVEPPKPLVAAYEKQITRRRFVWRS